MGKDTLHPLLLVNFGGPRNLKEVAPFLRSLFFDQQMIRTRLPPFLHRLIFEGVAEKRTGEVMHLYASIGGGSSIFSDTEYVAHSIEKKMKRPTITFHRYLESTHEESFRRICSVEGPLTVLPLFPHFSFATTGSIQTLFAKKIRSKSKDLRWITSYFDHKAFIELWQRRIALGIEQSKSSLSRSILLFSAHGLPLDFIKRGDPYLNQIEASVAAISKAFPGAMCRLGFQSKFGNDPWLEPSTEALCHTITNWTGSSRPQEWTVFFIPISFTSDHIETLAEIERDYLPVIRQYGFAVCRLPCFNRDDDWIDVLIRIVEECGKII